MLGSSRLYRDGGGGDSDGNHYGDDEDNPTWTMAGNGAISRSLGDLAGNLIATTSATGDVVLQLSKLHGDIATQIPLVDSTRSSTPTTSAATWSGTAPTRYGWLGARSVPPRRPVA